MCLNFYREVEVIRASFDWVYTRITNEIANGAYTSEPTISVELCYDCGTVDRESA